jgi:hypothetical protein
MRLPHDAHTSRPWRIHEITGDFRHYPPLLRQIEREWTARSA